GAAWLRQALEHLRAAGGLRAARLSDVLAQVLAAGHRVQVVYHRGGWVNVNDLPDLIDASGV
ncbi:MAG: phosphoenolpyruvate mutase, partial [Candidatus Rokubacteria bacterium]|nr:phosphoenolpyruvate mutase [Candidatus Rokubacteria bacterium]